jgi:hypothetical protein
MIYKIPTLNRAYPRPYPSLPRPLALQPRVGSCLPRPRGSAAYGIYVYKSIEKGRQLFTKILESRKL